MNPSGATILIADDELSIRRALQTTLFNLGFAIVEATRGEEALSLVRTTSLDAVLLDINMPGMGGIETCRRIRRIAPRLSILMLTVQDSEEDKIEALDAGADDYITKPFHVGELTARIRAAVRRFQLPQNDDNSILRIGEIELDPARRIVLKSNSPVHLTPKEFDLLRCLMSNAGIPVRHARLLSSIWGAEYGQELEYLRTFIHQLRKKLEDNPAKPRYLLTEAWIGYRFADANSSQ